MNRILKMVSAVMFFSAGVAHAESKTFGEKITIDTTTSLAAAINSIDTFKDKDILASGTVSKVCEKKGCWMTIKTDTEEVRVTFKDYGFFVPLTINGKSVRMQGRLERKEVSVADQKHLLKDAGAPSAEIESVKSPKFEFTFVAAGVEVGA